MDLTGLPALDVAIGLSFIFFLLAVLALTIQEFIASALGLRARTLEQGLRSMLEDEKVGWKHVDEFYEHPLIKSLYRTPPPAVVTPTKPPAPAPPAAVGKNAAKQSDGKLTRAGRSLKRTGGPSYISPRSFALVLLDNVAPAEGRKTLLDTGAAAAADLPGSLGERIQPLIVAAGEEVEQRRINLEAWYDDTMARVSGWYKRKTQIIIIAIAAVLVLALNANAITMAQRMWKDDAVRSAVVAAQAAAAATPDSGERLTPQQKLSNAADDVDKVAKVGIPMGWSGSAVPHGWGIATAVFGWFLTVLAISLGAPFWFDALSRFSRLRSSGKPETPLPAAASGKSNERILTPPQTPPIVIQQAGAGGSGE